jgi:hypothetical protein
MAKNYDSAVTNQKAFDLMTPELRKSLGYETLNQTVNMADFNIMPDPDAKAPYITLDDIFAAFDEVKVSQGK